MNDRNTFISPPVTEPCPAVKSGKHNWTFAHYTNCVVAVCVECAMTVFQKPGFSEHRP
jgi:hypothetical protein